MDVYSNSTVPARSQRQNSRKLKV